MEETLETLYGPLGQFGGVKGDASHASWNASTTLALALRYSYYTYRGSESPFLKVPQ